MALNEFISKFTIQVVASRVEMQTKVTIGLCVKNAARIVKTAFDSISIQDYPHELMKLVIVIDGSSDNTLLMAVDFAQKTDVATFIVFNQDSGLGAARQVVVDNAEGDYVLWVDDDYVLTEDYVKNQVDFMEKNPIVGAAKGSEVLEENPNMGALKNVQNKSSTRRIISIINFGIFIPHQLLNHISTGGSIFRLKALESVSGFDVRIKGAGEDVDVSRRIKKSGWTLAVNNSARFCEKSSPATPKALWKRNFGYGYGNHFLFHKHKDQHFLMQFFPPFALLAGLKMASKMYSATNMKKVFAFVLLHFLSMIPLSLGFARAHLDGYGHVKGI